MRDRWEEIKEERIRDKRKERTNAYIDGIPWLVFWTQVTLIAITIIGLFTLSKLDVVMAGQDNLSVKIDRLSEEISQANTLYQSADKVAVQGDKSLYTTYGSYEITHYCKCTRCCGKNDGITATGTQATAGRTIAVDPKVIPLGTEVIIDGQSYIAEDTGGAIKGNKIDIFCDSHEEAINRGRITREVFVKEE